MGVGDDPGGATAPARDAPAATVVVRARREFRRRPGSAPTGLAPAAGGDRGRRRPRGRCRRCGVGADQGRLVRAHRRRPVAPGGDRHRDPERSFPGHRVHLRESGHLRRFGRSSDPATQPTTPEPLPGYSRSVDSVGYTVDVPDGWVREEVQGKLAPVVTYTAPGGSSRLMLFEVKESSLAESSSQAEAISQKLPGTGSSSGRTAPTGRRSPTATTARRRAPRTWSTTASGPPTARSTRSTRAAPGRGHDGPTHHGPNSFCPADTNCASSTCPPSVLRRSSASPPTGWQPLEPVGGVDVVVVARDLGVAARPVHRLRLGEHRVGVEAHDAVPARDGRPLSSPSRIRRARPSRRASGRTHTCRISPVSGASLRSAPDPMGRPSSYATRKAPEHPDTSSGRTQAAGSKPSGNRASMSAAYPARHSRASARRTCSTDSTVIAASRSSRSAAVMAAASSPRRRSSREPQPLGQRVGPPVFLLLDLDPPGRRELRDPQPAVLGRDAHPHEPLSLQRPDHPAQVPGVQAEPAAQLPQRGPVPLISNSSRASPSGRSCPR